METTQMVFDENGLDPKGRTWNAQWPLWLSVFIIGVINYLADIHIRDLLGLANMIIAKMKLKGRFTVLVKD